MEMDGTTATLLRWEDMLAVDIDFENVRRVEAITGGRVLIPADPAVPAFVTVTFPPQAVLERVKLPADPSVDARFSGPTRLVFQFPQGRGIPFTTVGLLGWTGLVNAPDRGAVECVWDLVLRPAVPQARWTHAAVPVTSTAGVTELWHTRLTMGSPGPVPIADVRSQGFDLPFPSSLTKDQRVEIARAAAVRPLLAHELVLSTLGATVDLARDWADLPELTMVGYRHRAVLGRDERVSAAERGFLFPFGFPARLDTYTERRLGSAEVGAALEQTVRLTVTIPEIRYDSAVGVPFGGRDVPFRRIRLDDPLVSEVEVGRTDALAGEVFWVNTPSGARLAMNLTAEDREGHTVSFSAPVAFVRQAHAFGDLRQAVLDYDQQRQQVPAPATGRISLLPAEDGAGTAFDVTAVYLGARVAEADPATLSVSGLSQATGAGRWRPGSVPQRTVRSSQVPRTQPARPAPTHAAGLCEAGRPRAPGHRRRRRDDAANRDRGRASRRRPHDTTDGAFNGDLATQGENRAARRDPAHDSGHHA